MYRSHKQGIWISIYSTITLSAFYREKLHSITERMVYTTHIRGVAWRGWWFCNGAGPGLPSLHHNSQSIGRPNIGAHKRSMKWRKGITTASAKPLAPARYGLSIPSSEANPNKGWCGKLQMMLQRVPRLKHQQVPKYQAQFHPSPNESQKPGRTFICTPLEAKGPSISWLAPHWGPKHKRSSNWAQLGMIVRLYLNQEQILTSIDVPNLTWEAHARAEKRGPASAQSLSTPPLRRSPPILPSTVIAMKHTC